MSDLRLALDDTDFEKLVELGRAMIPAAAPGWTDHNLHDPGIMLVELLAWVADAQVYALSRIRRDERQAYARLLGVTPRGPVPAQGLVWPRLDDDPKRPASLPRKVVPAGTAVTAELPLAPAFFTTHDVQLSGVRLVDVHTRRADGTVRDWTGANAQPGASFLPFGDPPAVTDVLRLTFESQLAAGRDGPLSLGLQLDAPGGGEAASCPGGSLFVSIEDVDGERPLGLLRDTTGGLSRSGVLLLRVAPHAQPRGPRFTLNLRARGLLRSPRVERIDANVLPVQQRELVREEEPSSGTGLPDQTYHLKRVGLIHPPDPEAFTVAVAGPGGFEPWSPVEDLSQAGPDDAVFRLDAGAGAVRFGNGVNGRVPPPGATIQLTYAVSAGSRGNLPAGLAWSVTGIDGTFGTNPEPTGGGADGRGLDDLQALGRQLTRQARPLVTSADLQAAALALPGLGVQRAQEIAPQLGCPRVVGTRLLMVVGPDAPAWRQAIRRALMPRLPLGQRLEVIAPRYVSVGVRASLLAAANLDPAAVETQARQALQAHLSVVGPAGTAWPLGRDLTPLAVKGWLRNVPGVAGVREVQLQRDGRPTGGQPIALGPIALPRLELGPGDIVVERPPPGGKR
jgi:hypothetical protein